jgi:thymidine kinase
MFSGKTEEMIRRVRRATYARKRVQIFKHALDTRSEPEEIRSHAGVRITAAPVASSKALLERIEAGTDLVAVEETQFFDGSVVDALQALADRGVEVIASGLDLDFRGRPFGPMPALLSVADEVVKLRAICTICGRDASRTQRLVDGEPAPPSAPTILVGASEHYEARCRHHHEAG